MDEIKRAFQKVRQDIEYLSENMAFLKQELRANTQNIEEIKQNLLDLCQIIQKIDQKSKVHLKGDTTYKTQDETDTTDIPTHNPQFKALKHQNLAISTGNQGVPTDRQTDRQTDRRIENTLKTTIFTQNSPQIEKVPIKSEQNQYIQEANSFKNATEILDKLDNIKREIRIKFKRLTEKEILVFSTLYQIEEEKGFVHYKQIADRLNLTESSIRDYIGRLIKKGIPVEKNKINNKIIQLSISSHLKKIASLATILKLRDL